MALATFYVMFAEPVVFAEEHPADHLLARMKLTRMEPRGYRTCNRRHINGITIVFRRY